MFRVVGAALASLLLVSGVADAAAREESWFVGAAFGPSTIDDKAFKNNGVLGSTDDEDTAWQVWGGYRLGSWVAMQGRYVSMGEFSSVPDNGVGGIVGESQGLTVDMKVIWPFGASGIDVYALLGIGVADWDVDLPAVPGKPAVGLSGKEPLFAYGVGVRWTVIPALTISLAVDGYQYKAKGIRDFPNPDPDATITTLSETVKYTADILTPSIGLQYNF